jgi:CBS domain-containing protein
MQVSQILKTKGSSVKTIRPETPVRTVAQALRNESVGVMVVTDEIGTLKGIISERDLARGMAEAGETVFSMKAADLMTADVVTCGTEDSIAGISRVMTQRRIRHLPVMTGRKIVGLVSIGDVLKHRLDEMQLEANVLRDVAIAVR